MERIDEEGETQESSRRGAGPVRPREELGGELSGSQIEQLVNELIRKCCNFESGDGGRPARNRTARSQAARSNSWSMN
jgi:hypothetical protein